MFQKNGQLCRDDDAFSRRLLVLTNDCQECQWTCELLHESEEEKKKKKLLNLFQIQKDAISRVTFKKPRKRSIQPNFYRDCCRQNLCNTVRCCFKRAFNVFSTNNRIHVFRVSIKKSAFRVRNAEQSSARMYAPLPSLLSRWKRASERLCNLFEKLFALTR